MISASATEFFSITSLPAGAKHSSPGRSHALCAELRSVCRKNSIWEILKRGGIGVTRRLRPWSMLQQDSPDDYVIATGESHTVRDFLDLAASFAEVRWQSCVESDPRYLRPTEVNFLQGDASKARKALGWRPEISFEELVRSMVDRDLELARQEYTLLESGHRIHLRGRVHG